MNKLTSFEKCDSENPTPEQVRSLLYLAESERRAAGIAGIPENTPLLPLTRAAVIGAGTMGGGIAMLFANAGIPVLLKEATEGALDRGVATIRALYGNAVKHGRISPLELEARMALITPTLTCEGLNSVDVVIEAVFESLSIKQQVFRELSAVCRPDAILATNTSTLNIDDIAAAATYRERIIGTHFFTPPPVTRLLEIVRGRETSTRVAATAMHLSRLLGKLGVVVGNCTGFVANRMSGPYFRAAQFLLEEGASAAAIDQSLQAFGMSIGPMLVADLVGHDLIERIRCEHLDTLVPGAREPFAEQQLFAMGRLGRKTRAGWYLYDEARHPTPDPQMDALLRDWCRQRGVPQRPVSPEEIVERCIFALINEGAKIIEEGYVDRASDVDVVFVNGYGFPAWRGGPMHYADSVGLRRVYDRIIDWHAAEGPGMDWAPAPLLLELAKSGKTFEDLANKAL